MPVALIEAELESIKSEMALSASKTEDLHKGYKEAQATIFKLKREVKEKTEELSRSNEHLDATKRQLQMANSKVRYVETTAESERAALAAAKEHEKHWREGYESIYGKYTKIKEELAHQEHEVDKERADAEAKVRRVVRKAERAIKFFKDAAF